jgi:hypothetical protein
MCGYLVCGYRRSDHRVAGSGVMLTWGRWRLSVLGTRAPLWLGTFRAPYWGRWCPLSQNGTRMRHPLTG